jgi:hypothetical protein
MTPSEAGAGPALDELVGEVVVLDTAEPLVYIGRLAGADESFLHLAEADLLDGREANAGKGALVMEARRSGYVPSRDRLLVRRAAVLSLSRLEDVRLF